MAQVLVRHNPQTSDVITLDVRIELTGVELEASDPAAVVALVAKKVDEALHRERTKSRARTVTK